MCNIQKCTYLPFFHRTTNPFGVNAKGVGVSVVVCLCGGGEKTEVVQCCVYFIVNRY